MLRRIGLKNFRTHEDTTLELGPITLLIGANNAGKSNLLAGLRHFSWLASRGRPAHEVDEAAEAETERPSRRRLRHGDFFPHRHRLAPAEAPMGFSCLWTHKLGEVEYQIELYEHAQLDSHVACREHIRFWDTRSGTAVEVRTGWDEPADELSLQTKLQAHDLGRDQRELASQFFRDLGSCYIYHFQPAFFKGKTSGESPQVDPERLRIASQLGTEGGNLQRIVRLVQEKEERTFNRFLASLQRFDASFRTIGYDRERDQTLWLFDLGRLPPRFDEFLPDVVSDGLLRAAAIALLSSMRNPPALILVEEIENGISQRNLGHFLAWLRQAAGSDTSTDRGYATQFVVTSHSASVLREFWDNLDEVFHVRLERRGYRSVVRSLNSSLAAFVDMGTVEGEYEETDGRRIVKISPDRLVELWYSGAIGGEG